MRYRPRTDANQLAIVDVLRKAGCSVQVLAVLGNGCPDLLIGKHGVNILLEIKNPKSRPSQRTLTDDERGWHAAWLGQVAVVESAEEALQLIKEECGSWAYDN